MIPIPAARKNNRTVLLLTRYGRKGASSRIRHYDLIPGLRAAGFHVEVQPLLDDENLTRFYERLSRSNFNLINSYMSRLNALGRRFDFIWIEKEALPWLPWWLEHFAFDRKKCATVVDFDDDWVARYENHPNRWIRTVGRRKMIGILRQADAVTAANPFLASRLEQLSDKRPEVVFNAIDLNRYAVSGGKADAQKLASAGSGPRRLHVGWIGTPYTADLYLPVVEDVLNRLAQEGVIETILIGAGTAARGLQAHRLRWSEDTEVDDIAGVDVGIMPLASSTFDIGKSGWKLVQSMAAGRPVVAWNVGFNNDLVEHGKTGFLVNSAADFETALRQMAATPAATMEMGRAAQASLRSRYGIEKTVNRTVAIFEDAWKKAHRRSEFTSR